MSVEVANIRRRICKANVKNSAGGEAGREGEEAVHVQQGGGISRAGLEISLTLVLMRRIIL